MRPLLLLWLAGCNPYPFPDLTGTWVNEGVDALPGVDGAEPTICSSWTGELVLNEDGTFTGVDRLDLGDSEACPDLGGTPGGWMVFEQAGTWVLIESASADRVRFLVLSEDVRRVRTESDEAGQDLIPLEFTTFVGVGEDPKGNRYFMDSSGALWWEKTK